MSDRETYLFEALAELVCAIEKKWEGESDRRRANALSPRIEDALTAAKKMLSPQESGDKNGSA